MRAAAAIGFRARSSVYCDVIDEKISPTNYNLVQACTDGRLFKIKAKSFSEEREEERKKVAGVTGIILWAQQI